DGANLVRERVRAQDLDHHVVGDSGQYQVRLGRGEHGSTLDDEDVARRSFRELAVANQDRLYAALIGGEGAQHAIAEQRSRLDVAAEPAEVGQHDRLGAVLDELRGGGHQLARHQENGGFDALGEGVAPLGRAAGDLEIDVLVIPGISRDDFCDELCPLRERVRVGESNRIEARLEPGQMLLEAERPPRIHRDQLVDTVPEYKAAVEHRNLRLLDRHKLAVE